MLCVLYAEGDDLEDRGPLLRLPRRHRVSAAIRRLHSSEKSGTLLRMPSAPSPDDFDRLVGNVRDELQSQNAMGGHGLTDEVLDRLASAIAVNVDYGFDVRWAPNWVKPGQPHAWQDEEGAFAECVDCRVRICRGGMARNDYRPATS